MGLDCNVGLFDWTPIGRVDTIYSKNASSLKSFA